MNPNNRVLKTTLLLAAGCILTASLAQGAQDDRHDRQDNDRNDQSRGQHEQDSERRDQGDRNRDDRQRRNERATITYRFQDEHRVAAHDYYEQQYRRGRCPPGLSRKNNNCIAPGHAKNWQVGQRLPNNVVYYDVPPTLVARFGPAPRGSRYVRVASDILLIALGTGLVIDAIDDMDRR